MLNESYKFKNEFDDFVEYRLISGDFPVTVLESIKLYGIRGTLIINGTPIVFEVPDISSSQEKVAAILSTLVRLQVSPRILNEIVVDFIDAECAI